MRVTSAGGLLAHQGRDLGRRDAHISQSFQAMAGLDANTVNNRPLFVVT
jgi:hypothetical protein